MKRSPPPRPSCDHCRKLCKAIVRNADGVFCRPKCHVAAVALRKAAAPSTALAVRTMEMPAIRAPLVGLSNDEAEVMREWLEAKSEDTVRSYRVWLHSFVQWFTAEGLRRPESKTDGAAVLDLVALGELQANRVVQRWINRQVAVGVPRSTYAVKYAALRSFVRALKRAERSPFVIDVQLPRAEPPSPMERARKFAKVPAAYLKTVAMLERLAKRRDADPMDVRDWAIVRLARDLGFRKIEWWRLDVDDVVFDGDTVKVLGKGRKKKTEVPLPSSLVPVLRRWLKVRADLAADGERALFVSVRGGRRPARDTFYTIVRLRSRAAGVKLTPHDMRRIHSTRSIQEFGLNRAKALTRHKNVATLEIYDLSQGAELAEMAEVVTRDEPLVKGKR
jgi:integrase/recombinase XerC